MYTYLTDMSRFTSKGYEVQAQLLTFAKGVAELSIV